MTRTEAYLALHLLPQMGPVRARKLLAHFDSPEKLLAAPVSALLDIPGVGRELAEAVANWQTGVDLEGELRKIRERDLTLLTQEDALYPELLKGIHDPPLVLYVWGELTERDHRAIGVVGSRLATTYGLSAAKKLSFQIAYAGYSVISGLARGIDTAAHEGALAANGRTVAIIGSGLGRLYPPENQALAAKIAENGAVISEYPVDRPADKQTFPYRNRIVAGWSNSLLVVEAPTRSGSLITAQQAIDHGRTVYAVPGGIDRPASAGCNRLIQQGAKLVMDGSDILDDLLDFFPSATRPSPSTAEPTSATPPTLTLDEEILYRVIGQEAMPVDDLISLSGLTPATVNPVLMRLEMKRLIRALPGRRYQRTS